MPCHTVPLQGGGVAIVCTGRQRRKKCKCGRWATLECDWKVPERKSGTCDAPICARCATSPAPGKDLCVEHAEAFKVWLASRPPRKENPCPEPAPIGQITTGD